MSIAGANTVLNSIVEDAFSQFADELEGVASENMDEAVKELIVKTIKEHQKVIFNGDGYSQEWVDEAKRRGLPNYKYMVDAIPSLLYDKSVEMFERLKVYSRAELESRAEIDYEAYAKAINIEAKTMIEMASKRYIPAIIKYTSILADSINSVKNACPQADISVQTEILTQVSTLLAQAQKALTVLREADEKATTLAEGEEQAQFFKSEVTVAMENLRTPIDALEMIVDKTIWPVPSYGDLLFEV